MGGYWSYYFGRSKQSDNICQCYSLHFKGQYCLYCCELGIHFTPSAQSLDGFRYRACQCFRCGIYLCDSHFKNAITNYGSTFMNGFERCLKCQLCTKKSYDISNADVRR